MILIITGLWSPSFLGLKPMFEPQCSQTGTRHFKHLILHFISSLEPNATPNGLTAVCCDTQMRCTKFLTFRFDLCSVLSLC